MVLAAISNLSFWKSNSSVCGADRAWETMHLPANRKMARTSADRIRAGLSAPKSGVLYKPFTTYKLRRQMRRRHKLISWLRHLFVLDERYFLCRRSSGDFALFLKKRGWRLVGCQPRCV